MTQPTAIADALVLDGGTGTELDRRGVDISLPLWSARAIIDAPQTLLEVHRDYLLAGADLITANTFRTHRRSLAKAGVADRAAELTMRAVAIAREACRQFEPRARVLGSVAPLEDCYSPDLVPDVSACNVEHAEMIDHLAQAGADLILIETMMHPREAEAAADAARQRMPGAWMMSFCVRSEGPPGILLSGHPVIDLLDRVGDAWAVGINCVAAPAVEANVKLLRELLPGTVRIAAYANIGLVDEYGNWVRSDGADPVRYAEYTKRWQDAGASIIGGCCGTTPAHIKAVRDMLRQ